MKSVILCADDYGQNEVISQAIIELLKNKRLSATSCMTTASSWPRAAKELAPYHHQIDIGLHFNLTHGPLLTQPASSLANIMTRAYLGQISQHSIEAECHAQLDLFIEHMQRLPDFIDGHQHVHQLPIIRQALLSVYEQRLTHSRPYIRCVHDTSGFLRVWENAYIKRSVIHFSGASSLQNQLIRKDIPHNISFQGVYNFAKTVNYKKIFVRFLKNIKHQGLIMCHPGFNTVDPLDPINTARYQEYQYFQSQQFIDDCVHQQITLKRFQSLVSDSKVE